MSGLKRMVVVGLLAVVVWPATVRAVFYSEKLSFEGVAIPVPQREVFQDPTYSGSTRGIKLPPVTLPDLTPYAIRTPEWEGSDGIQSLGVVFTWGDSIPTDPFTDDPYAWVRVTTLAGAVRPNPSLHTQGKIRFKVRNPNLAGDRSSIGLCIAVRETGVQVPQMWNGGGTGAIEWVGVSTDLSVIENSTNGPVDATVAGDDIAWIVGADTKAISWGPDRILQSTPAGDDVSKFGYIRAPDNGAMIPIPALTIPTDLYDWTQVEVDLSTGTISYAGGPAVGTIVGFTGDGILNPSNNRGTLESLCITNDAADARLNVGLYIDELEFESPVADPIVPPMVQSLIIAGDTQVTVSGLVPYVNQVTLYADLGQVAQETVTPGTTQVTLTISAAIAGQGYTATQRDTSSQISGYSSPPIVVASGPPPYSFSILVDEGGGGSCSTAPGWEYVGASSAAGWIPQGTTFVIPRDGVWQTIDIPLNDPAVVKASPVGNGTLAYPSATGNYTMDTLWFTIAPNADSNGLGPWEVLIDAVQTIDENGLVTGTILNMEDAVNRLPYARGQSTEQADTSVNTSAASYDGVRSHRLAWTYDTPAASQSLGILQRTSAGCGTSALIPDSAKKVRFHMVCRGLRTAPTIALPLITGPVVGSQTGVRVTNDATATAIQLYVDGLAVGSPVTPTGTTTDITGLTLTMGQSVSATQTLPAGTSDLAYPRFVGTPLKPTVQTPVVPLVTSVTVTGVLAVAHATASTVTVYANGNPVGSAAGGTSTVPVTTSTLHNGDIITAKQTVNGVDSELSSPVTVAVPAPSVQPGMLPLDTVVTVNNIQLTAAQVTVYVDVSGVVTPTVKAVGGVTSTTVTVAPLNEGDQVWATQTIESVEGPISAKLLVETPQTACGIAFSDNFNTNTSANYTINTSSADTAATFAFDYSTIFVPPSPNGGGTTKGLKLEANMTPPTPATTEAITLSPINQRFGGDYHMRFDMWINANGPFPLGGTGSTQFVTAGVGYNGTTVNGVTAPNGAVTGSGGWFAVDGEGGTTYDYRAYKNAGLQYIASGQYHIDSNNAGTGAGFSVDLAAKWPGLNVATAVPAQAAAYPQQNGTTVNGSAAFAWHQVIITRRGTKVTWEIDGLKICTIDQTIGSTFPPTGRISIGYWDPFASVSDNAALSFGIIDNLVVESWLGGDCNGNNVADGCETFTLGDYNADGLVNLVDYVSFEDCMAGPGAGPGIASCDTACLEAFDADSDGDVDEKDFGAFQDAF